MSHQNVSLTNHPKQSQDGKPNPGHSANPAVVAIQSAFFLLFMLIFMAISLFDTLLLRLQYQQEMSQLASSEH